MSLCLDCLPDKFSLTWDCLQLWTRRLNTPFCTFKSEVKTQALKAPNSKQAANRLKWTLTLNAVWNAGNWFEALEKLQRPWRPIQNQGKPYRKVHWFASGPKAVEFTIVINQWKAKSTGEVKTGFSHPFTIVPAFSKDLQNRASMRWTTIRTKTLACTYIDIYIYIFFVGFNRGRSNTFWQSVARLLEPVPGLCLKSISIPARQALALSSSSRCRLARRRLKLHCEEALRLRFRFANLAGCLRGGLRHLPISRERHHAYGYGWIGNRYCDSANIGKQFDTKSFPFWLSWQPAILGSTCLRLLSVCLNLRLRSGPSCRTGTSRASLV